jgi:3-deoxy-manno-octulosonate cytidylyltransferase (CMP-KDO synthetase)
MKKAVAIIPARYASSRFPGKPLVEIKGKSMITRVYDQVAQCPGLAGVWVATDDQRIYDHIEKSGRKVIMTSPNHSSGTERCHEAFMKLAEDSLADENTVVVNVQGDEPFIEPSQISDLLGLFNREDVEIATLVKIISIPEELNNPNCVKAVTGLDGKALYFSRAAIPFIRDMLSEKSAEKQLFLKHIGLYAYRSSVLKTICSLPATHLEQAEKLEQLRWLEHGFSIHTARTEHESIAIDTPEDLKKVTNIL